MSNTSNPDELPSLSDYDVQLLHRIVSLAEESNDPPFRALFAAYDITLAEYGIQADHDRVYFRFLLRMGELSTVRGGLFERFQGILWKLGIEVAFGEEDPVGRNLSSDEAPEEAPDEHKERGTPWFRQDSARQHNLTPSRRSSFEDIQGYEERVRTKQKPQKHVRSRSVDEVTQSRPTEEILSPAQPDLKTQPAKSRRDLLREPAGGSKSRPGYQRQTEMKHSQLLVQNDVSFDSADSDSSDDEDRSMKLGDAPPSRNLQAQPVHRVLDKERMEMNAKNLRYHHLAAKAILIFRSWMASTVVVSREHTQMLLTAISRDRETLSRQAMEQWRTRLQDRKREHETESFYEQLAQKARRARDLFLLSKAFTHWAEFTSEELSRTSAAKRFMIKSRYFNSWREVTVVNEFKVRRHGMLRFWQTWRRRTQEIRDSVASAQSFRDLASAEKCYRRWFWAFCEHRAPLWYDGKIKLGSLSKWMLNARQNMVREHLAVDLHTFQLIRKFTIRWLNRSATLQQNVQQAQVFRQRMLMLPVVEWLQKELELLPIESQVSSAVRFRTLKLALDTWKNRTRYRLKAELVNRLRTLRNVWTCWNDRLRCQTLSNSIDERLVLNALYKWVLAERSILFRRVADDNSKSRIVSLWKAKTDGLTQSLSTPYHLVRSLTTCQTARSILQHWNLSSLDYYELEDEARLFRERTCIANGLRAWIARDQNCSELDQWATNARFYMITNRSVKKWQDRTANSRKAKRREAYALFRRNVKMNLARTILHEWLLASDRVGELRRQAEELDLQHLRQINDVCYDTWREKSLSIQRNYSQASAFDEHRLLRRGWDLCTRRMETVSRQEQVASAYLRLATEAASTKALRQITWRVFKLKGQDELAESLLNRTSKKHYRNMLRYWASQMRRRQTNEASSVADDTQLVGGQILDEWPEIEESVLGAKSQLSAGMPPTPGYLRTPSRRHPTRNYAHLRIPRTPATTQLTPHRTSARTPFSQPEFSQSTRNTFARRLVERQGHRIDDILETSPVRYNEE